MNSMQLMSLLRRAFITHFMAVRRSQVLSEEASGHITANCQCARLHWSALISNKLDMVWERSAGIRPPRRETDALSTEHCDGFTKHNFTLTMLYFPKEFLLLGLDLFPAESQV